MANAVTSGASAPAPAASSSGGGNPFQVVTNLYAEKNNLGAFAPALLGASTQAFGGAINAGNFLRGVRFLIRTTVAGVAGSVGADGVFNVIQNLVLTNVDGSEILYSKSGYAHSLAQKYFRPWETDPYLAYDYTTGLSPSGTLFLKPEIRWSAGVLANTDTRSQYRFDGAVNTLAAFEGTAYTTSPTISITPYMDAFAQPDGQDLQGSANQQVPPGVNLQVKQRHQIFTMNAAGSDNVFLSTLTGNALRAMILIARDGNGVRQDALSDPIQLTLDNRNLGKINLDIIRQWMDFQYSDCQLGARETGVYVYPRFLNPGSLTGSGWLYTSNATKFQVESATASGITGNGTLELITDEVYPVGPVQASLVDI